MNVDSESPEAGVRSRRNSLRQSVRSPLPPKTPEPVASKRRKMEQHPSSGTEAATSTAKTGTTLKRASAGSSRSTTPKLANQQKEGSQKSVRSRKRNSNTPRKQQETPSGTPRGGKGKGAKLHGLREENRKLSEEVRQLKREVDIWNNRIKTGRRLAKFTREIKPAEDEIKRLEPEWKELKADIVESKRKAGQSDEHVERMLSDLKSVLAAAQIKFTDGKVATAKDAMHFLKTLTASDKAAVREAASRVKFDHD